MFAFDKFKAYLLGISRVVFAYHSTLKYLPSKEDARARLIRWILMANLLIIGKYTPKKVVVVGLTLALVNYFTLGFSKPRLKTGVLPKTK